MNCIKDKIFGTGIFNNIPDVFSKNYFFTGINGSLDAFLVVYLFERCCGKIIITSADSEFLFRLKDDVRYVLGNEFQDKICLYLDKYEEEFEQEISPLSSIIKNLSSSGSFIILLDPSAFEKETISSAQFSEKVVSFHTGQNFGFSNLITKLNELGLTRTQIVTEECEFAVRGGIVDIFPENLNQPVRIEFLGDTIESIREFDASTQRSINRIELLELLPQLSEYTYPNAKLSDYLRDDINILIHEPDIFAETNSDVFRMLKNYKRFFLSLFPVTKSTSLTISDNIQEINFSSRQQPAYNSNLKLLFQNLLEMKQKGFEIILSASDTQQSIRFKELIDDLDENNDLDLLYTGNSPHKGFILPERKAALLTEHEIFSRYYKPGIRKRKFSGITFKELSNVNYGDYMVHRNFGIGKYAGLKKIRLGSIEQEAVKLIYSGNSSVFVNLNSLHLINKYSAQEGISPKLSTLGGSEWEKLKQKTKKKIQDIAEDLITLYAKRKSQTGFRFSPDSVWQKELEASFIYEDTPDQLSATNSVKKDMEDESPMDRLICGDVGFGKTEIAIRAAFKAVLDNKQAAVLVPTTILAEQHYYTFKDRLASWAVEVEHLSRFKSKKEQTDILKRLKEGKINIIIGTHRLLSKDVKMKDLGLLIIDEEQRFGVKAKEKLKTLKENVDVLTLTATPIPRTLNFSLLGARDLSVINTPPKNRQPIHTEIINFDIRIISEAINREIQRGGQVYFVNDKISKLEEYANMIEKNIQVAEVSVAHGQMNASRLEKVMLDFLQKKTNVLVCTKIIESGLDIPSVNTIIINRADNFGLAELYQLRGRVGRSNIKSFAYLVTPPQSSLTRQAIKRLHALEEFSELGSGMNLALRDLEIRGAGNLLGKEQSGFISELGFDTYMHILDEAITELKSGELGEMMPEIIPKNTVQKINHDVILESDLPMFIPEEYIEDENIRLDIYQRLSKSFSAEEILNIQEELIDRFGKFTEEVQSMFAHIKLKILLSDSVYSKLTISGNSAELFFDTKNYDLFSSGKFEKIISLLNETSVENFKLHQTKKSLSLKLILKNNEDIFQQLTDFILRFGKN